MKETLNNNLGSKVTYIDDGKNDLTIALPVFKLNFDGMDEEEFKKLQPLVSKMINFLLSKQVTMVYKELKDLEREFNGGTMTIKDLTQMLKLFEELMEKEEAS